MHIFQLINPLIELFMHSTAEPEEEQVSGKPSGELLNSLLSFFCVCVYARFAFDEYIVVSYNDTPSCR